PESQKLLAEGWEFFHVYALYPDLMEYVTVDAPDLYVQHASLFSMCIDYPLQADFFDRICRFIGHFPTPMEIEQAHREMKSCVI
ncbi:MAG: hypothetical protein KKB31_07900, partial [Nanoarchaeota archaeon]|nr:hypothetical protein [Nanoarchaeota archaeon]